MRADRVIITKAVTNYGPKYASEDLRADREIVTIDVAQNGLALEFASEDLQADEEIVSIAETQNDRAKKFSKIKTDYYSCGFIGL